MEKLRADLVQSPRPRLRMDAPLAMHRLRGDLIANWHLWEPDQRRERHRERRELVRWPGGRERSSERAGGRGNAQRARRAPVRLAPPCVSSLSWLMPLLRATCERKQREHAAWATVSSRLSASAARKRLERPESCPPGKAGARGMQRSSVAELALLDVPACSTRSRARALRWPHGFPLASTQTPDSARPK